MAGIEYRHVNAPLYKMYMDMASMLLDNISKYTNKRKKYIIYSDIISYFEDKYNILFTFFESSANHPPLPSDDLIKYIDIVKNAKFRFLDDDLASKTYGVTIPEKVNNKSIIMINQSMPKQRIIFTILHELVHLHFHNTSKTKHLIFASKFSGKYSSEMIHFEDEANVIASLLFCSTEQLEAFLLQKLSFNSACSQICMSKAAMHNRLLNYFQHILNMNYQQALNYVLRLREGEKRASYELKTIISQKKQNVIYENIFIKMSNGISVKQNECQKNLQLKSIQELILELEYAHATHNYLLEQLVMDEYYKKVK
jgi:hypothetical protein